MQPTYLSFTTFIFILFTLFSISVKSDPAPHSDHSKLYILSRLAFTYLDVSNDGRLSESELDAMRYLSVNGLTLKSMFDVKRIREAMDKNKNGFVDESEFLAFEYWLPLFINGRPNGPISTRELLKYAKSARDPPAYVQLDKNKDGQLDKKELTASK